MSEIFLSYAREDSQHAYALYSDLYGAGFDVWFDKRRLEGGQDWKLEIEKAIRDSKIFIACLSSKSVTKRGFVQAELRSALEVLDEIPEGAVYLIPVRFDDCDVPQRLRHLQYVNAFDDGAIPRLVTSITNHLRGAIDYPLDTCSALRFVLIRIDDSDLNWAEAPLGEAPTLFDERYDQFFDLIEFVEDADPIFDITIQSRVDDPLILTHIGVRLVVTAHQLIPYGFPTTAKIKVEDTYIIEMPDIFKEIPEPSIFDLNPARLERDLLLPLRDPLYFEGNAPYRFKLRLKYYTQHIPNHTLLRFIAKSDHGDTYSHLIRTFTW